MTINSRAKGKNGELEFVHYLVDRGIEARRGQQYRGGDGSPDVVSELDCIHWEVKRAERVLLHEWLAQAVNDAGEGKWPVVAHRRSRGDWVAVLPMKAFLEILEGGGYRYASKGPGAPEGGTPEVVPPQQRTR